MQITSWEMLGWMSHKLNQDCWRNINNLKYTDDTTLILWPLDAKNWLFGKDPDAGKYWRQEEKGMTEDEMVG